MNKQIIIAGIECGYFRAKDADKRALLAVDIAACEQFADLPDGEVSRVLEAEAARRSAAHKARLARTVAKAEEQAARPVSGGVDSALDHVQNLPPGCYVLTTAQNNTDVDPVFFGALLQYCKANGARLLIAKTTYNKNGFLQPVDATEGVYYAPEVIPHLVSGQIAIGDKLHFIADANVLPTAKNPLSGFAGVTLAGVSAVIPASKIALQCLAALKGAEGKMLFGTGTVTKRNYVLRKAGAVASTEHNIGALFVHVRENGEFDTRQLERMDCSPGFYDNGAFYTPDGVDSEKWHAPAVLQFGDIHAEKMETRNLNKMLELIDWYKPHNVMLHDVCDFSSRNHHNVKDCTFIYAQSIKNETVAGDITKVSQVINALRGLHTLHIIESNHDLAINTWLKNADFKQDPVNALTYLQLMTALYKHIESRPNDPFNMLAYACEYIGGLQLDPIAGPIKFHETDESVIIAGVEHGCHGHTGINGAKGSPVSFRGLGVKMNTGHTHTPSIHGGVYTAGVTGSLEMGYNVGPSSWKLANVLTYPNGQRQIIFM